MVKMKERDSPSVNWTQEGKPFLEAKLSVGISVEDWFGCEMGASYASTCQVTLNPGNINYKLQENTKFNLWSAWALGQS